MNVKEKEGSIYECRGNFKFIEHYDEEEEDWDDEEEDEDYE